MKLNLGDVKDELVRFRQQVVPKLFSLPDWKCFFDAHGWQLDIRNSRHGLYARRAGLVGGTRCEFVAGGACPL